MNKAWRVFLTNPLVLALVAGLAVQSASAVPIARLGHSDDPWDSGLLDVLGHGNCMSVASAYLAPIVATHLDSAVGRLENHPVISLSDAEAAEITGVTLPQAASIGFARAYLADAVRKREEDRRTVLETHVGSWSRADQIELDQLQAVLAGDAQIKPFLVRALSQENLFGDFTVQSCPTGLYVQSWASKESWPAPKRTALVLLTSFVPERIIDEWYVNEDFYDSAK